MRIRFDRKADGLTLVLNELIAWCQDLDGRHESGFAYFVVHSGSVARRVGHLLTNLKKILRVGGWRGNDACR